MITKLIASRKFYETILFLKRKAQRENKYKGFNSLDTKFVTGLLKFYFTIFEKKVIIRIKRIRILIIVKAVVVYFFNKRLAILKRRRK